MGRLDNKVRLNAALPMSFIILDLENLISHPTLIEIFEKSKNRNLFSDLFSFLLYVS